MHAGSGFYRTEDNVLVYGSYGQKADMAGHHNHHIGNIYAYVYPVCYVDLGGGEATGKNVNEHRNNTCIQRQDYPSYVGINCKLNSSWPQLSDNRVYKPSGRTSVCGVPLAQWQARGLDPGTRTFAGLPTDAEVTGWAAKKLLLLPQA